MTDTLNDDQRILDDIQWQWEQPYSPRQDKTYTAASLICSDDKRWLNSSILEKILLNALRKLNSEYAESLVEHAALRTKLDLSRITTSSLESKVTELLTHIENLPK